MREHWGLHGWLDGQLPCPTVLGDAGIIRLYFLKQFFDVRLQKWIAMDVLDIENPKLNHCYL